MYLLPGIRTYSFRLTVLYMKKAPQLSAQELVAFTKKMAAAAQRCCPLRDEQQSACVEDQVITLTTHLPSLSGPWESTSFLGHIYDLPVEFKILRGGYFQASHANCLSSASREDCPLSKFRFPSSRSYIRVYCWSFKVDKTDVGKQFQRCCGCLTNTGGSPE